MTTTYVKPFNELVEQAREVARELGQMPSQNKLKATLHVRSERARTVLAALRDSGFNPTAPEAEPVPEPAEELRPDEHSAEHKAGLTSGQADYVTLAGTLPADLDPAVPESVPAERARPVPAQVSEPAQAVPMIATAERVSRSFWHRFRLVGEGGTTRRELVPGTAHGQAVARAWPIVLLAAPAMVAIWSGWVGLGALTGFGMVHPLPGIADGFTLNSAITLPIGVETYAAYALRVWLATGTGADQRARSFAKWSAIGSLGLGAAGQVAYHLMTAHHVTSAPWEITTAVACLPVIVLGFGAALAHLQHHPHGQATDTATDREVHR